MKVSNNYIAVEKCPKVETEGFTAVEVQDNFLYKGVVKFLPECPVFIGNEHIKIGDVVLFAKYSPDVHEYKENGADMKLIGIRDILAVL